MRFVLKKSLTQINDNGKKKQRFQIVQGDNQTIHQLNGVSNNGKTFQIKEKIIKREVPKHNDLEMLHHKMQEYKPLIKVVDPKDVYRLKPTDIKNLLSSKQKKSTKTKKDVKKDVKKNEQKKLSSKKPVPKKEMKLKKDVPKTNGKEKVQKIEIKVKNPVKNPVKKVKV
jgi:hypothetical protein